MKGKNLLAMAAVAAVLVILAAVNARRERAATPDLVGKPVFKDLAVNDVEKVQVVSGASTIVLARVEDTWVSPSKYGHPADFGKIKKALLGLVDLKVGQVVQVSDAQRAAVRMVAPGQPAATNAEPGRLIVLQRGDGGEIASLLLGDSRKRQSEGGPTGMGGSFPDGQYVSPNRGKDVFLVKDSVDYNFPASAMEWLEDEIADVNSSDVEAVTIAVPGEPELRLTRKDSDLHLAGLGEKEELDSSKVSSIKSALQYLRFNDVADPALKDDQTGMDKPVVFTAECKNGEVYTARIGKSPAGSDNRYLRISAALKPQDPPAKPDEGAAKTDEEKKKAEEDQKKKADERAKLEEKIRTLNERTAKWTFLVASYKSDYMTKTRKDIVKAKEEKKEEKKEEPAKTEPAKADSPKVEAPKPEPAKVEPAKAEAPKAGPVKAEPPKAEAPKADSPKAEAAAPEGAPKAVEDKKAP